ncbi:hypothetical protein DCMF_11300 [Candidatus Formimonas warabiya]|uniref:Uncharacterized protein n=1 Tax=Formimonas warabiya TaxID=1761012 RepID=A0A3G1KSA1_FORW1|nr:hypothetical protein DCMF_11300 [Candidatus Formimonas warabiya]
MALPTTKIPKRKMIIIFGIFFVFKCFTPLIFHQKIFVLISAFSVKNINGVMRACRHNFAKKVAFSVVSLGRP